MTRCLPLCGFFLLLTSLSIRADVIAYSTSGQDSFLNQLAQAVELRVSEYSAHSYVESADHDLEAQVDHIRKFTQADVDAIILTPVSASPDAVKQLLDARGDSDIPLVFLNVMPDQHLVPDGVVVVGSNEVESGTMEMETLAELADYQGQVAILKGQPGHPAAEIRTQDIYDVVDRYEGMKVSLNETANWSRNEAFNIVTRWLKESPDDFNIIAANNDEMALGAIMALEKAGVDPNRYWIGGVDASPGALRAMKAGILDVTILQDGNAQARSAVDAAFRLMAQHPVASPIWVPFKRVTPDQVDRYLE
ncbi:hypothetical protein BFW38_02530 [Terasakiispira papahanaumokuakeensis]|uniref:Periplasmic binding protein domain-containing protein n=1 Tax=Terasakiispira papahanaumokuakeensis TaxID=197479 RepID=A0A1E2V6G7_9GAMM|nr:sugar ABC transporter substrate-binding protein [Terasakiispira papahanaumokuakeensis]ODC02589.1 hypothetical protein BFW38_02530 [Terasakiispira papahanaumokuakeensis]